MGYGSARLALAGSFALLAALPVLGQPPDRIDHFGDPLPAGAVARLGTLRFRNASFVKALACSADGKRLAVADGEVIRLWDAFTGKEVGQLGPHEGGVLCLAYSSDGTILAAGDGGNAVHLWDTVTGRDLRRLRGHKHSPDRPERGVVQLFFHADGKTLVSRGADDTIRLWDLTSGRQVRQLRAGSKPLWTIALAADGMTLAAFAKGPLASGNDTEPGEVRVWELRTGKQVRQWLLPDDVALVAFSPDLRLLVTSLRSGSPYVLTVWGVQEGKPLRVLPDHPTALAFSADGKTLLTAKQGSFILWDLPTGKKVRQVQAPGLGSCLREVAFCPDGKTLVSWGCQNTVAFFDLATGKQVRTFAGHEVSLRAVAFSPDGKLLASADPDEIRLWDLGAARQVRRFGAAQRSVVSANAQPAESENLYFVTGLTFLPDGKTLLASSANTGIHRWDLADGRHLAGAPPARNIGRIALSPDARLLATWNANPSEPQLAVWDTRSWKRLWEQERPNRCMTGLAFSPDGATLAAACNDPAIQCWAAADGRKMPGLGNHPVICDALAFSPDGRTLAAVDWKGSIRLWERATGQLRGVVDIRRSVSSLTFSPDGKLLAAADNGMNARIVLHGKPVSRKAQNKVYLLDVFSGKVVRLPGHRSGIRALAFSPDGKRLASASDDTTVLLWDVAGFAATTGVRPGRPGPAALEALWTELASGDGTRAYRAIGALVAAPRESVPFLKRRLRPRADPGAGQVNRLLRDLDSDRYAVRQNAAAQLQRLGRTIEPALREAFAKPSTPEFHRRVALLLAALNQPPRSAATWQALRAVEVLEYLGTAEARQVLETLAGGAPSARLTCEARTALGRLGRSKAGS